jgi:hypothetical protein
LRKPEREILAELGAPGDLILTLCGRGCELKLSGDDGSRQEPADQDEAVLTAFWGTTRFLRNYFHRTSPVESA